MYSSTYLTANELAATLRISVRTLYTYVEERRVPPPLWLGGKRLWTPQVVHDFIAVAHQRKRH